MTRIILWFLLCLTAISASAEDKALYAHIRHRPPEMLVEGDHFSGPLKDIIDEAAAGLGYTVKWQAAPFALTLRALQQGTVDLVPRMIRTPEREALVAFIGPLGFQQKDILFVVKKGAEDLVREYTDLYGLNIGVKRGSAYFGAFDDDMQLHKTEAGDDNDLARLFAESCIDVAVVLDTEPFLDALAAYENIEYAYADYRYEQNLGSYYGLAKNSPHAGDLGKFNRALAKLVRSGRVAEIYQSYNLAPPEQ